MSRKKNTKDCGVIFCTFLKFGRIEKRKYKEAPPY